MVQSPATELDRVTIHLSTAAPPGEHGRWLRRATNALAGADLTPPGFPSGAILVVRRLADPAPGALWRGEPWQAADRWGQQARTALALYWRRAVRPALGAVPADAGAVWFADRAEWLACLSRDLVTGDRRWWWAHWQKHLRQPAEHLATLWREEARWLPAACALLHAQSAASAIACANLIPPTSLAPVRAALIAAHALPPTWQTGAVLAERIAAHLPGTPPTAGAPEAAQIVALALLIHHRPAVARSGPQAIRASVTPDASQGHARGVVDTEHAATPPRPDVAPSPSRPVTTASPGADAPALGEPETGSSATSSAAAPRHLPPQQYPARRVDGTATSERREGTPGERSRGSGGQGDTQDASLTVLSETPTERAEDAALPTALGGVWYLLNVLEALDWLDDIPPTVDPWLKLGAVARLLLWQAQGNDAGTAADPPPPRGSPLSAGLPAGISSDPLWGLLAEQARPEDGPAAAEAAASDWALAARPTIEGWLAQRLGVRGNLPPFAAAPARIALSRTHLAVHFRLDQIDLAIRMAGLDRDPGWLPRLRRVVQFFFA